MNEFVAAYMNALRKWNDFSSRTSRKEFWYFVLVNFVIGIVIGFLAGLLHLRILSTLYNLFITIPSLAIGVRRLHDIGKSGLWILLWFIPIIGWIVLIYFYALPGNAGPNEYGDVPPPIDMITD